MFHEISAKEGFGIDLLFKNIATELVKLEKEDKHEKENNNDINNIDIIKNIKDDENNHEKDLNNIDENNQESLGKKNSFRLHDNKPKKNICCLKK